MTRKSSEAKARSLEKRRQRRRIDAEFKAKEQNENTLSHRERRSDPIIHEEEQEEEVLVGKIKITERKNNLMTQEEDVTSDSMKK